MSNSPQMEYNAKGDSEKSKAGQHKRKRHRTVKRKSFWEYTKPQLFWLVCIPVFYYFTLFRCLGNFSYRVSIIVFLAIVVSTSVIGTYFSWKHDQNDLDVIRNSFLGSFLYFLLTYFSSKTGVILLIIFIFVLIAAVNGYRIYRKWKLLGNDPERADELKVRQKLRKAFFRDTGFLISIAMVVVLFVFLFMKVVNISVFRIAVKPEKYEEEFDTLVSNNMDTIELLRADDWYQFTPEKRLMVAQTIVNLEVAYLGLPSAIPVGTASLEENTLAHHVSEKNIIEININKLDSMTAFRFCKTICHEVYHSYQDCQIRARNQVEEGLSGLAMFRDAEIYEFEQYNYIDGDDDMIGYENQRLEKDADDWGEKRAYYYLYYVYTDEVKSNDTVVIDEENKASLYRGDDLCLAGPYSFIEQGDDLYDRIRRYKTEDGLFGYLDRDGRVLVEAKYIYAGPMTQSGAKVSEKKGQVYYINTKGERVSEDFVDGTLFEWGGNFARVKTSDGKWNLMFIDGRLILTGADAIDPLTDRDRRLYGAVIGGHAALIFLTTDGDNMICEVKKEFEQYVRLEFQDDEAVIGRTVDGLCGAMDSDGNELIPAEYSEISYESFRYGSWDSGKKVYLFTLTKPDGTVAYVEKEVKR